MPTTELQGKQGGALRRNLCQSGASSPSPAATEPKRVLGDAPAVVHSLLCVFNLENLAIGAVCGRRQVILREGQNKGSVRSRERRPLRGGRLRKRPVIATLNAGGEAAVAHPCPDGRHGGGARDAAVWRSGTREKARKLSESQKHSRPCPRFGGKHGRHFRRLEASHAVPRGRLHCIGVSGQRRQTAV